MPQRLLLEGSDIDELLQRVQAEHGPQATIVHAEQKLVGGVAGFFARRRYELSVQIDDPAPDAATPTTASRTTAVSSTDGITEHHGAARVDQPATFEDLLARADGADGADVVDVRTPAANSTGSLPAPRGRRLSTQSPQFEDLLSTLLGRAEGRPSPAAAGSPDITSSCPPARQSQPATGARTTSAWERVVIGGRDEPKESAARDESRSPAAAALLALGLPEDLLPAHVTDDPRAALLDVLATLPPAPARRLWGTTVVVGPADLARRALDALVEHTGGTGAAPLVADSTAPSSADLAVRASALCASHGSAVVVIETPATRVAARRTGRLLAGLGLGTVIAAVDATRDAAATREWLAELGAGGRRPDQIAAFDVAESPTPLGLLGLGPDVGWVDGRAATVGAWAAPCLDRHLAGADGLSSGS